MAGAHALQLAVAHVEHVNLLCAAGRAIVLYLHHRAAQPDAHRRTRAVELAVVGTRRYHVVHVVPGNRAGIIDRTSKRAIEALPSGK